MMIFVSCRLYMYVGMCMCVFLMRWYISTFHYIQVPLPSVYVFVCGCQVCQIGQEEVITRDSSARCLRFPLRFLFCFLFAICHKKNPQFHQHGLIFRCRRLQKCRQMETAPLNIFQAHLIPGRPSRSAAAWQSPCPSFPQKKPHVQEVLTDLWFAAESDLLKPPCKKWTRTK